MQPAASCKPMYPQRTQNIMTTATAGARRGAAKPSTCKDKGSTCTGSEATSGDSGSSPAQLCPLHACLVRHGIADLAAFSAPRHLALSQEAVSGKVEPKLAALVAEGLSPKQMAELFQSAKHALLACSNKDSFQTNLRLLRQIAAYTDHRPQPKAHHLTAAGKILADSPAAAAMYQPATRARCSSCSSGWRAAWGLDWNSWHPARAFATRLMCQLAPLVQSTCHCNSSMFQQGRAGGACAA